MEEEENDEGEAMILMHLRNLPTKGRQEPRTRELRGSVHGVARLVLDSLPERREWTTMSTGKESNLSMMEHIQWLEKQVKTSMEGNSYWKDDPPSTTLNMDLGGKD